jgi:hypothetical protein
MTEFTHHKVLLFFSALALRKIDHGCDRTADAVKSGPAGLDSKAVLDVAAGNSCGICPP